MPKIDIDRMRDQLAYGNKLLYFVLAFGVFLIFWRLYYYFVGHYIRFWVTILWICMAFWLILWPLTAIPWNNRINKAVLGVKYEIHKNRVIFENMLGEKINIKLKSIKVIVLNDSNSKILATGIFYISNNKMYQIRVDKQAGMDIAYHCLKWYMDGGEDPKCVIVREISDAYKVLKQLVPKRIDPVAEIKPARHVDEERFLRYVKENYWLDREAIEYEIKRLEKEMNKKNLKIEVGDV